MDLLWLCRVSLLLRKLSDSSSYDRCPDYLLRAFYGDFRVKVTRHRIQQVLGEVR